MCLNVLDGVWAPNTFRGSLKDRVHIDIATDHAANGIHAMVMKQ